MAASIVFLSCCVGFPWHRSVLDAAVPVCYRPPVKAYTDISAMVSSPRIQITAGQEPAFAAVSQSVQRLVPASRVTGAAARVPPDAATPHTLAWWDRARYMWRGRMRCSLLDTTLFVSPAYQPDIGPSTPRLELAFKQVELSMNPDAQATVLARSLSACVLLPHHEQRSRPDAASLRVPMCSLASVAITSALSLEMPGGIPAGSHHVHPVVAAGQRVRLEGIQGPVDVSEAFAAVAITASVNMTIHSIALCGLV